MSLVQSGRPSPAPPVRIRAGASRPPGSLGRDRAGAAMVAARLLLIAPMRPPLAGPRSIRVADPHHKDAEHYGKGAASPTDPGTVRPQGFVSALPTCQRVGLWSNEALARPATRGCCVGAGGRGCMDLASYDASGLLPISMPASGHLPPRLVGRAWMSGCGSRSGADRPARPLRCRVARAIA